MKFKHLLFDADDTLFDFPKASARAFSLMCAANEVPNSENTYQLYKQINDTLWAAFDRGEVDKEFVVHERFVRFLNALHVKRDPVKCNQDYLSALGQAVYPLPNAEDVCRTLSARGYYLYIVTNAVASVQRRRLHVCPFGDLFREAFISEEAGSAKPNKAYFDYVRQRIPDINSDNTLVIGDSLTTDMQGANNAALPCCWFNPMHKEPPSDLRIDYVIHDLRELLNILP